MRALLVVLLVLPTVIGCVGEVPPPPELRVTSPERGFITSQTGRITVEGTVRPGPSGSPVSKVTVNGERATLPGDGSFTATIDVPDGATLLETVAFSEEGGSATDARAVQVGELRPVGSNVSRAIVASLSADAFETLSAAAGPFVKSLDLMTLLAPIQPMAALGDNDAHVDVSVTRLAFGDVRFDLTPVDGGLQFSAQIDALDVGAHAIYGGIWVPEGSTDVTARANRITIAGTLVVTPDGMNGFDIEIASPDVVTTDLRLEASGIVGTILDLLNDNLRSTVTDITTRAAELALKPLINLAFGALAGPQQFEVLDYQIGLQAAPAAVTFTRDGALVALDLAAKIGGGEVSPGYIFTPNGTPSLDVGDGVQVALADDLVNEVLAQVHAIGLLDIELDEDFVVFDHASFTLSVPPMISASTEDGKMRLVLGDMIASFSDGGTEVIRAAINAQVDLAVAPGSDADQISLQFGDDARVIVNILETTNPGDPGAGSDLSDAAATGIALQLGSMEEFLITLPVPSVAGVTIDSLGLHADAGYVVMSGEIH
jgi:hypothetical protein